MLYLLNDMVEEQLRSAENKLSECKEDDEEKIQLTQQIQYFKSELEKFKKSIDDQLKVKFQFSIEELYAMYGQYENKYLSIEFHKFSNTAQKFGRNIGGTIKYAKSEREDLEKTIAGENVPRTNGLVKFDASNDDKLSAEQKKELIENGFISGDIYQVSASDYPVLKSFNQSGVKEIPHTIEVKFDPTDTDINHTYLYLFSQRINNGGQLIPEEWAKFCGIGLNFEPSSAESEFIKLLAFDKDGNKKPLVRFYELEAKFYSKEISKEELAEFGTFLKQRRIDRTELIKIELKSSTNKTLEKFKEDYPEIFKSVEKSIVQFDTETLVYHKTVKPIFWDYKSFLHIYLRHCDELEIEGHFENKTKFQYTQKDIRRILIIAIENLADKINERLSVGKEFRIWGDKSLYFNGNHYSLHILENGRVAAFHPLENPK